MTRLGILALLLITFQAGNANAEDSAVLKYEGKCLAPGAFDPLVIELSLTPVDAQSVLSERLPSLEPSSAKLTMQVVDAAPLDEPSAAPVFGLTVRPFFVDPDRPTEVRLYAEPFHHETVDTFRESTRAAIEALLRVRLGDAATDLPHWLIDGLALWLNDRGDDVVKTPTYGWHLSADELVPGLEIGDWSPWRRYEDRMAIHYLVDVAGADAPDRLVEMIAKGKDWRVTLVTLAGERHDSWASFVDGARASTRATLARRATDASQPLLDGWTASRDGDWLRALGHAQAILRQGSQDDRALHGEALWLGARALNELDNPREALKPIEHFLHLAPRKSAPIEALSGDRGPPVRHLLGRVHFEHARARFALGDHAGAAESLDAMRLQSPDGEFLEAARSMRSVSDDR